ncbi:ATP-binding cassette domain-containing protein [Cutibacterium sp. WCA-380-WT-3A]|uniref:ATP-binding cassette domain-containing protein n=1 Tax=Cutibacterium porci TaxID=2605781 RepID=A0A7K0J7J7_9ACTN|nr:ATP-binding cassette domain-containing protein [Cutibacterium porci]
MPASPLQGHPQPRTLPDSGHIVIDGTDILAIPRRRHKRVRRETIGYLFHALLESATVRENLDIAAHPRPLLPKPSFASALERVGLPGQEQTPVHTLSGGEQQRVALARLLLKPSRIILADEPTASLDRDNEDMILNLLQGLANEGKVILLATHSDRVASRCSQVLSLHHR